MSQQLFLNVEQCFDILMAELPDGVFAQDRADDPDPAKRSYSSAELRTIAQMSANAYANLNQIYLDKFASTVTLAGLANWEKDFFASAQDSSLPYITRQQNLLAKIRSSGGISLPVIEGVVSGILSPLGVAFAIIPWSGQANGADTGAWILGVSELGSGTYLSLQDPLIGQRSDPGYTPLDCSLDYAAAGLTQDQLTQIQQTAYTYEVRIYGNVDQSTLDLLDSQLTALEPARSTHVITNNASGPAEADSLDAGLFGDPTSDKIVFGYFDQPAATYDIYDFGGF